MKKKRNIVYSTNKDFAVDQENDDIATSDNKEDNSTLYLHLQRLPGNRITTIIRGLNSSSSINFISKDLKKKLGVGGSIKNNEISFDEVAKNIFKNEFLKENGGDIGWVKYDDLDPNLERNIFPAVIGEMSRPIRSSYGWHIMIKLNERSQILIDEFSYNIRKNDIKQRVIKKLKQIRANNYVNDLMLGSEIIINDTLSNLILNAITKILDFGGNNKPLMNFNEENKEIISVIGNLNKYKDLELASYKGSLFLIEDLINGMRLLNLTHLRQTPSRIFHLTLRNKILFEEGMKKNIHTKYETKMKLKDSKDRIPSRLYLKKYFKSDKMNVDGSKYLSIADSLTLISKPIIYQKRFSSIFDYKDHN